VSVTLDLLSPEQARNVHEASLSVLSRTGMRFGSSRLLHGLKACGARVDEAGMRARIPAPLVEATLASLRRQREAGAAMHMLNGVTSARTGSRGLDAKLGGGCERWLDWGCQALREPTSDDLLQCLKVGEQLPEVGSIGTAVVIRHDIDGELFGDPLRRIGAAALVAKHTRKPGCVEVRDPREIDFLTEIGIVARGSREAFMKNPCLLTARETISPLFLDRAAADVLEGLAVRGLPCTVIPMPITGLSAPATPLGSVIIGNAEILGTITAIRSVHPDAMVGGGMISGLLDMATGAVSFSAPEACLQDMALAEIHERLYGLEFLIGSGYTDAKYPSAQVLAEKVLKFTLSALTGRTSHPVGLINAGSAFCLEQALVDLELCRAIELSLGPLVGGIEDLLDVIDHVGPQGCFTQERHTLEHFRENWIPRILDRAGFESLESSRTKDVYARAHAEAERLRCASAPWEIEPCKAREIDAIVACARAALTGGSP
jgi:trimethylamine--corrinoid protein Co-methyltransferase